MRIQILPLPSVVVGDDVQEPFALIVDQWPDGAYDSSLQGFADMCGAKAVWVRSETVEVVDRYAEPAPAAPQSPEVRIHIPEGTDNEVSRKMRANFGLCVDCGKRHCVCRRTDEKPQPIVLRDRDGNPMRMGVTCSCGSEMTHDWDAICYTPGEPSAERTQIVCKGCGNRLTVTVALGSQT